MEILPQTIGRLQGLLNQTLKLGSIEFGIPGAVGLITHDNAGAFFLSAKG